MALVVFLRGINVGGYRRFRPSVLARDLADRDAVNVGAAGTFVIRRPGSRASLRAAILDRLSFEAEIVICEGRDLLDLRRGLPFGSRRPSPDRVRFVAVLSKAARRRPPLPARIPPDGEWLVRLIDSRGRFVFGEYRRSMKTIGCLGRIDELFGAPATIRSWTTVESILRILEARSDDP